VSPIVFRMQGCGSESLQGDVRFAEVMGLMGANVQWSPYSITITGPRTFLLPLCQNCRASPSFNLK